MDVQLPRVSIFYATAGEGHKKAAEAIRDALKQECAGNSTWQINCLDALEFTNGLFKYSYPAVYHFLVTHAANVWGLFYELFDKSWVYSGLRYVRHIFNRINADPLIRWLTSNQPDIVVCTHFLSAEVASHLKKTGRIKSHVIVVVTDYAAHALWVNAGTDFYTAMHEDTRKSIVERGGRAECIRVLGIPIRHAFLAHYDRPSSLNKRGLDPRRKTILITSGGFGMGPTEDLIDQLEMFSDAFQVIVVCGHNIKLETRMRQKKASLPIHALGFVDFMPELMAISDLAIIKPGGLTATECLAMGVPFVVSSFIPGQEGRNISFLKKYGAVRILHRTRDVQSIVQELLENSAKIKQWKENLRLIAKPRAAEDMAKWLKNMADR